MSDGANVQLYDATDPISQQWVIVPVDMQQFRIVPLADMTLSLMAYRIFIDQCIQAGNQFYFSHDPTIAPSWTNLCMEYTQLVDAYQSMGYTTRVDKVSIIIDGVYTFVWHLIVQ